MPTSTTPTKKRIRRQRSSPTAYRRQMKLLWRQLAVICGLIAMIAAIGYFGWSG